MNSIGMYRRLQHRYVLEMVEVSQNLEQGASLKFNEGQSKVFSTSAAAGHAMTGVAAAPSARQGLRGLRGLSLWRSEVFWGA